MVPVVAVTNPLARRPFVSDFLESAAAVLSEGSDVRADSAEASSSASPGPNQGARSSAAH